MIHQMLLWCGSVQVSVDKPVSQCCQKESGEALWNVIFIPHCHGNSFLPTSVWRILGNQGFICGTFNPVVCPSSHVSSSKIRRQCSCFLWRSRTPPPHSSSEWNQTCRNSKYIPLELAKAIRQIVNWLNNPASWEKKPTVIVTIRKKVVSKLHSMLQSNT